jgi:thymidylate kinase
MVGLRSRAVAKRVVACADDGDWSALEDAVRLLFTTSVTRSVRITCRRLVGGFVESSFAAASMAIRRPGLSVALLGPDGAGKSTVASRLEESFGVPVRRLYLGLYGRAFTQRRVSRVRGLGLAFRLLLVWRAMIMGRIAMGRGYVVVFDRHTYDVLASPDSAPVRRARRWLLMHAVPKPDVVLLLDAPSSVLAARKGAEHSLGELERKRLEYKGVTDELRDVVVIDAAQPAEIVAREITHLIWRRYTSRVMERGLDGCGSTPGPFLSS